jgi:hypothetical protein
MTEDEAEKLTARSRIIDPGDPLRVGPLSGTPLRKYRQIYVKLISNDTM